MRNSVKSMNHPVVTTAASILAAVALLATGCHSGGKLPDPSSKGYAEEVSAFYVGLAALQVGDDVRAQSTLEQATQLAPGEPAAWANWGILALRQRNFDPAAERLNRARQLAPQNGQIYYLLGLLGSARGDSQQAIINLRKAVSLDPENLRASYALALEVERQGAAGSEEEFQKLIQQILAAQPNNLAALLELSRISAKREDSVTLHATIQRSPPKARRGPPTSNSSWPSFRPLHPGPSRALPPRAASSFAMCSCRFPHFAPAFPTSSRNPATKRSPSLTSCAFPRHRPPLLQPIPPSPSRHNRCSPQLMGTGPGSEPSRSPERARPR